MVLEYDDERRQLCKSLIGENRPLGTLNIDLRQISATEIWEHVHGWHGNSLGVTGSRDVRTATHVVCKSDFAVGSRCGSLVQHILRYVLPPIGVGVHRVRLEGLYIRIRPGASNKDREESDIRPDVKYQPWRAECGSHLDRWIVIARTKDLIERFSVPLWD